MRFEVATPLGFSVRTTDAYWELIGRKHPEVTAREMEVQRCLAAPDMIRRSTTDPAVYLFYLL